MDKISPRVLVVFGTRPELIKLAPLIRKMNESTISEDFLMVNTAQHIDLLKDALKFWDIRPDITFLKGKKDSSLVRLFTRSINQLQDVLDKYPSIEYVIVQGDTNTALACTNFAFLNKLKLIHIEAGLRTFDIHKPFPEEYNRVVTSKVAYLHFVHSDISYQNLIAEGVPPNKIILSGNTIIDSLITAGIDIENDEIKNDVIITMHRRENVNQFDKLINIIETLSKRYPSLKFKWIGHPNYPLDIVKRIQSTGNIFFSKFLTYPHFIKLYNKARIIITDSGGVTEEAAHLGIPIVVFRNETERTEPLQLGHPMIVSLSEESIYNFFEKALNENRNPKYYFGKGNASEIIFNRIKEELDYIKVNTTIIGGGPGGTGTVLKSMKDGNFEAYAKNGIAIIEKSPELMMGSLADYQVNSDTISDVFLECLDGHTEKYIDINQLEDEIKHIKKYKGNPIPLYELKPYLSKLGSILQQALAKQPNCSFFLNTAATEIIKQVDGNYLIHLSNGRKLVSNHVIFAPGANMKESITSEYKFANNVDLSKYVSNTVTSDSLIKGQCDPFFKKFTKAPPKIVIMGGNHSAFSAADYLLRKNKSDFSNKPIIIWADKEPKIFYRTEEEALLEGYTDFKPNDICPITKRVYRLAGLRMDGRNLYINMLGLKGAYTEKRVILKLFNDQQHEVEKDLKNADLIIHALGYRLNMIPTFDEKGNRIKYLGAQTDHWVDGKCRLLGSDGKIIENMYAMGLATGFIPRGELGGEQSFEGQTNGLWYYQNNTAEIILGNILNSNKI